MYRDFYSCRGGSATIFAFHGELSPEYLKARKPIARSAINEDNPRSLARDDGVARSWNWS